jgi:ubiquinol-cytochrome c reductase cytochrome c subunit
VRTWLRRPSRIPRRLRAALAILLGAVALMMWSQVASAPARDAQRFATIKPASTSQVIGQGQRLYAQSCASCHGLNLRGRRDTAPSLFGVGAGAVDFYLSTGRMPLANNRAEPERGTPAFDDRQIKALIAYVRNIGGGPPAPTAAPSAGSLSRGFSLFDENCAGCHSIVARGGMTVGAQVPDLQQSTPQQIAEAIRTGPYLMPRFDAQQLNQHDLDSIARYVIWTQHPANYGGWGIYNIGPIPEGIAAWFIGLLALVIVARLIGERTA